MRISHRPHSFCNPKCRSCASSQMLGPVIGNDETEILVFVLNWSVFVVRNSESWAAILSTKSYSSDHLTKIALVSKNLTVGQI